MVSPNRTRATTLTKEEKEKEQRRPLPQQVRKAMELCVCACVRWRVREESRMTVVCSRAVKFVPACWCWLEAGKATFVELYVLSSCL